MRWRLTEARGSLAGVSLARLLANGGVMPGVSPGHKGNTTAAEERTWFQEQIHQYLDPELPTWILLPDRERVRRDWWQELTGRRVEVGYGRAGVTLALSQINRLQGPARTVALDCQPGLEPETWQDCWMELHWHPADVGLGLNLNLVDGRLDGKTDVGVMLEQARNLLERPDVLICPGTGSDGALERLMPFMASLGGWAGRDVRWEFAEARVGNLGVVGSLYNWFWLYEGYRLGDWTHSAAVLDLDTSPLVGISVVDYTA